MSQTLRVLMLGDSIGKTGRALFARHIQSLKKEYSVDAVIVNGENSGDRGVGITPEIAEFFKSHGADVITGGNHTWDEPSIMPYLEKNQYVLRPANFPVSCPGVGMTIFTCKGFKIAVINLMGRVFMEPILDCPFAEAKKLVEKASASTPIILVDFHACASSEKLGLAYFLEGKVSAVVCTHTHTLTNDQRVLPGGTAYITDLGMSGSLHSNCGFRAEEACYRFTTSMPKKLPVETKPPYLMTGVVITIDTQSGKAVAIEHLIKQDDEPLEEVA